MMTSYCKKFGGWKYWRNCSQNRQSAKINSPPKFLAIWYGHEGVMAYKMPSPKGTKCILYAITPECTCPKQYSPCCHGNGWLYITRMFIHYIVWWLRNHRKLRIATRFVICHNNLRVKNGVFFNYSTVSCKKVHQLHTHHTIYISNLGGIFTSAPCASVNMVPRVGYIGNRPPYHMIYITYNHCIITRCPWQWVLYLFLIPHLHLETVVSVVHHNCTCLHWLRSNSHFQISQTHTQRTLSHL